MKPIQRLAAPTDRPEVRVIWITTPDDDREVAALLADGWREIHRSTFGSMARIEMSNAPMPAPPPAEPQTRVEAVRRNLSHRGPKGAFRREARGRVWTE